MKGAIGDVLPFALVVTISPINIIAAIVLLFSKRPVVNAASYVVGFVVGVAAMLGALVAIAGTVDLAAGTGTATGAGGIRIALGVALLVAAIAKFRSAPKAGEPASLPKWMDGLAMFAPVKSLGLGVLIGALNPKNIAMAIAAALSIASVGLTGGQQVVVVVVYVVLAVLGVAAPVVVALVLGDRSQPVLASWKAWLERNNPVVMGVLFLVFSVVLVGKGIAAV